MKADDGHLLRHAHAQPAALKHGALRQIIVAEEDGIAIGMLGAQCFQQGRAQADGRLLRRHDFQRGVVAARIAQRLSRAFAAAQRTRVQLSPDDADAAAAALHQMAASGVARIELGKAHAHVLAIGQRFDGVHRGDPLRAQQGPRAGIVVDAGQDHAVGRVLQILAQQGFFRIRRIPRHPDQHVITLLVQHFLDAGNDVHEHHVAQRRNQHHDGLRPRRRQRAGGVIGHVAQILADPGDAQAQGLGHLVRRAQRARHRDGADARTACNLLHGDAAGV
ncbi:hypothetical protein D3C71_1298860 [compost metagenome]